MQEGHKQRKTRPGSITTRETESYLTKKKRSEASDMSNIKSVNTNEKSLNNISIISDCSARNKSFNSKFNKSARAISKTRSPVKSPKTKRKKKVNFREKNFVDIVNVESYKKYNVDISMDVRGSNEKVRCRCIIF